MELLDNLMQALSTLGQGTSPAQQQEMQADATLNRQGSLMGSAKAEPRATAAAQGPTMSTISDLVNSLNPINWMGGPAGSSAVIAPTANKTLLGLLESLRGSAPKLMQRAESTARTVFPYLTPGEPIPGAVGTYQNLNPLAGQVNISGMQSRGDMLSTLAHELQHFITEPGLATKNPAYAVETAQQLGQMMPQGQAAAVKQYTKPFDWTSSLASPQDQQAASVLTGSVPQSLRVLEGQGMNIHPAQQDAALRAYNEALSYLTESMLRPQGGGADPALEAIANALGHGIR